MSKIAIILPVLNQSHYLKKALQSLSEQTFKDFTVYLINDGSTENLCQLIEDYNSSLDIVYVKRKINRGLVFSLNQGFNLALSDNHEYFTWTSADNIYLKNALETMINAMNYHNVHACYADYQIIDERENTGKFMSKRTYVLNGLINSGPIFMVTRESVENAGLFDPNFSLIEDREWWTRINIWGANNRKSMVWIPEILYLYRMGSPESLTQKIIDKKLSVGSAYGLFVKKYGNLARNSKKIKVIKYSGKRNSNIPKHSIKSKIGVLCSALRSGGLESYIYDLISHLRKHYEVVMYCDSHPSTFRLHSEVEIRAASRVLTDKDIALVHYHTMGDEKKYAHKIKVPKVATCHGAWYSFNDPNTFVIAVSEEVYHNCQRTVSSNRMRMIPNPVVAPHGELSKKRFNILVNSTKSRKSAFVGRVDNRRISFLNIMQKNGVDIVGHNYNTNIRTIEYPTGAYSQLYRSYSNIFGAGRVLYEGILNLKNCALVNEYSSHNATVNSPFDPSKFSVSIIDSKNFDHLSITNCSGRNVTSDNNIQKLMEMFDVDKTLEYETYQKVYYRHSASLIIKEIIEIYEEVTN